MLHKGMFSLFYRLAVWAIFLFSLPCAITIGLFVVLVSGFPILFRQKRMGKNGKPFIMYKFRTMVPEAEQLQKKYQNRNESQGPAFKINHDPRFTRIGKVLSHTGLDELPQLYNVIRGEMALIGPRPLPVSEAKKLKFWMRERERILPGIISPAILTGTYHKNFDAWMRSDVAYAANKNPWGDLWLFVRFVPFVAKLLVRGLSEY